MYIKRIISFVVALLLSLSSLLVFNISTVFAANSCTWTGIANPDIKISTAANWSGCAGGAPQTGDSLIFPFPAGPLSVDNDTNNSFVDITFVGDGAALTPKSINISGTGTLAITGNMPIGYNVSVSLDTVTTTGAATAITLQDKTSSLYLGSNTSTTDIGGNVLSISNLVTTPSTYTDLANISVGKLIGTSASKLVLNGVSASLNSTNPAFDGELDLLSSDIVGIQNSGVFGTATKGVVLNNSRLEVSGSAEVAINDAVDVTGNFLGAQSSAAVIGTEAFYVGGSAGAAMNLAGGLTIHSDTLFDPYIGPIKVTGAFAGKYAIGITSTYTGASSILVNSGTNTSSVPNGNYSLVSADSTISDSLPAQDLILEAHKTLTLTGARGRIIVSGQATLKGNGGTAGAINVISGGTLAPGNSPGCINSGNITINGNLDEEIGGTTACSGYDQMNITGTVDISGATLNTTMFNNYAPKAGETYTIIQNDAVDAITGTFNGLAEGATFTISGIVLKISYVGGTGNDIVLTVQTVPGTPNTGFSIEKNNVLLTFITTTFLAGVLVVISKKYKQAF